jgi:nucleoside-diphosphate-sugar epimerase
MRTAIVTGASGFIGSKVAEWLQAEGVDVMRVDEKLGHDLRSCDLPGQADTIFHFAGCSDSHNNPAECFKVNALIANNLLRQVGATRLIFASTYLTDNSSYAQSKRFCEQLFNSYAEKNPDFEVAHVRCCNVYGPGDRNISRLVPSVTTKMLAGAPLQVTTVKRDFVFLDDAVDAYVRVGHAENLERFYGVSGTGLIPLSQVVSELADITQSKSGVVVVNGGTDAEQQDISALKKLGWSAKTSLREGLTRTVDWWRTQL